MSQKKARGNEVYINLLMVIDFGDKNSIYRNKVLSPDLHINIQDDYSRIY